jgi:hypothetical protein
VLFLPAVLWAAERNADRRPPPDEVVDVFSAIDKGQLQVRLVPRDSAQCRVLLRNKMDRPLHVRLPEAFAGVPVLAQPLDGLKRNQSNAPQPLGIGPGQNGLINPGMWNLGNPNRNPNPRGPNMPLPGPMFNIAPEGVARLKFASVCLEHGRPNPRPKFRYEMRPIGEVTQKAGVAEICAMLGQGKIRQRVAQLAAWHLNNDMSWRELANLREKFALGNPPTYTRGELLAARKAAEEAVDLNNQRRKATDGKTDSLSQR